MLRSALRIELLAIIALPSVLVGTAWAQQIHRYPFETRDPAFIKGTADAAYKEFVHDVTDFTSHNGQLSEHLQFASEQGSYIFYYYPTNHAPLADDLNLSLWVKANRPGIQLAARLVLPKERNPNNLDEPLTTILRSDVYQKVSRWQQLELRRPPQLAKAQQKVMRDQLKREVDFTDAYIDRILLNVYCGPGMTELWVDDLEIGPVIESKPFQTTGREKDAGGVKLNPPSTGAPKPTSRPVNVELVHERFMLNGRPIIFRGIRYSDTPLNVLRDAGFNTLFIDSSVPPAILDQAAQLGFWLVPMLHGAEEDAPVITGDRLRQELTRFIEKDAVLFWLLGGALRAESIDQLAKTAQAVKAIDPNHPLGADILDGYRGYTRHLDLQGSSRWPLFTSLELTSYRDGLNQRRLLGRSDGFYWTWLQTHMPEWYSALIYERPTAAGFDDPIGPQPEQIRLLTYIALASGCHGVGYWSDRFLADSHQGRDRLLEMALLNLELKMIEDLLVTATPPIWIDTSEPEVKAAVMRTTGGLLVLPMWLGRGAQCVPGQSARVNLKLTVPQAPVGTQPWEVSPAQVRLLYPERIPGGTTITIPEFGLTTAIIFTADNGPNGLVVRFQEKAKQNGKVAAGYASQLAEESLRKTTSVYDKLVAAGHPLPDGAPLLDKARDLMKNSTEAYNRGQFREAFLDADRALRPLRILMRAEWTLATRELTHVSASPYTLSYYTLPQHWKMMDRLKAQTFGASLLPDGDFELPDDQAPKDWLPQELKLDEVDFVAKRSPDLPHLGKQCLMLQVNPKNPLQAPAALERCYLGIHSPDVSQPPGTWVRISVWVRIPKKLTGSVDGALLYDSAGGEPLAVRLTEPMPWKEYVSYRRVPPSGKIHVTLALSALGSAYFDDVRIEPLLGGTPQQ